jgi:hypothetical protein
MMRLVLILAFLPVRSSAMDLLLLDRLSADGAIGLPRRCLCQETLADNAKTMPGD